MELSDTHCGSIIYSAPEVLQGIKYNALKSDLWSLGVVIFMMLQRKYPFSDTRPRELLKEQLSRNITYSGDISLTENSKILIENLLQPDVKKRYSAEDVLKSAWITSDRR